MEDGRHKRPESYRRASFWRQPLLTNYWACDSATSYRKSTHLTKKSPGYSPWVARFAPCDEQTRCPQHRLYV